MSVAWIPLTTKIAGTIIVPFLAWIATKLFLEDEEFINDGDGKTFWRLVAVLLTGIAELAIWVRW